MPNLSPPGPAGFLAAACVACAVCAAGWGLARRDDRRARGRRAGGDGLFERWPDGSARLDDGAGCARRDAGGVARPALPLDGDEELVRVASPSTRAERLAMLMALDDAGLACAASPAEPGAGAGWIMARREESERAASLLRAAGFPRSAVVAESGRDPDARLADLRSDDGWLLGGERLPPGNDGESTRNAIARFNASAAREPWGAAATDMAGEEEADDGAESAAAYCPRCAAAYVDAEGGCDYCPGVELVDDPPPLGNLGEWRAFARLATWSERERLRLALLAANIPVRAEAWDTLGMGAASGLDAYALLVPANCMDRARDAVRDA